MTMTDPIADMLTRLRNANSAYHDTVSMPSSKLKVNIAEMLKAEGYIAGYEVTDAEVGKTLTLSLKYGANRQRAIQGLRRISKPGLRVYAKSTNLPKVLGGLDVTVKGPKGTLSRTISEPLSVTRQEDGSILVTRPDDERRSRSLHGLSRTLINNMVIGVTEGYSKQLEIVGTGYRVAAKGQGIELSLGFSHTVTVEPPEGITFTVDGNLKITVSGISKEQVGEVAANIRKIRPPEPYKGKGVRYAGENVRRKVGKAGK